VEYTFARNSRYFTIFTEFLMTTELQVYDFGVGVTYDGWRMEDEQNRHLTGFLRDHTRSTTLRKTLSHMRRGPSPDD